MKTLLVANTDWYLYHFRRALAAFLQQQGFEVVFVSPAGDYHPRITEAGFRWIPWNLGRQSLSPLRELTSLSQLVAIYRSERPAFVHHFTMKPILYGTMAARVAQVSGIINGVTGLGYLWLSEELKARAIRPFLKQLFKLCLAVERVRVIFENQSDRDFFIQQGLVAAPKTYLIQGVGVDVDRFKPAPEPEGTPVIVLPARLLWDKGVGVLVEAARLLKPRLSVRVALVGRPDPGNPTSVQEAQLRRWAEEGVIEYWGWQEDMSQVYARSHIIVLPSFGEGVPTVLLEAAACGRPIVASDIPGCRVVVQEGINGFLVPVNQPAALAAALEKLAQDQRLRLQMGAAGRQRVLENFTDQTIHERTYEVYRSCLGHNSQHKA